VSKKATSICFDIWDNSLSFIGYLELNISLFENLTKIFIHQKGSPSYDPILKPLEGLKYLTNVKVFSIEDKIIYEIILLYHLMQKL